MLSWVMAHISFSFFSFLVYKTKFVWNIQQTWHVHGSITSSTTKQLLRDILMSQCFIMSSHETFNLVLVLVVMSEGWWWVWVQSDMKWQWPREMVQVVCNQGILKKIAILLFWSMPEPMVTFLGLKNNTFP